MSEDEEIEKLPGVGPAILEKLKEAGYNDLMMIAVDSPRNLAEVAEIGESTAAKIIAAAKKAADVGGFETGDVILRRVRFWQDTAMPSAGGQCHSAQ
jgi:DNA repair protein RadA